MMLVKKRNQLQKKKLKHELFFWTSVLNGNPTIKNKGSSVDSFFECLFERK